ELALPALTEPELGWPLIWPPAPVLARLRSEERRVGEELTVPLALLVAPLRLAVSETESPILPELSDSSVVRLGEFLAIPIGSEVHRLVAVLLLASPP